MKLHVDAAEHLAEIEKARVQLRTAMKEVRKRQTKLVAIVVKAYNEESAPIDGVTTESREVVLGYRHCVESPIGICAYSERSMSLPGQREMRDWRENKTGEEPDSDSQRTDACLFCGVPMDPNAGTDGRQLQAP